MTEQEKQILLVDLCARLTYKVMGHATWTYEETNGEVKYAEKDRPIEINDLYDVWNFKPYLRPMSSMTNQEIETYRTLIGSLLENSVTDNVATLYNFLNSKHLDYRGMIHMGLALEAPEGMYKN